MKLLDSFFFVFLLSGSAAFALRPDLLTCELLTKPGLIPVTDETPEFSWGFKNGKQGDLQTAYQIQVATSTAFFRSGEPDLWDSGKVEGADCLSIPYAGEALPTEREICWRVRVWDRSGNEGPWSYPYSFKTAEKLGEDTLLRYPLQQRHVDPVSITTNKLGNAVVDFGRASFGWLELMTLREMLRGGDYVLHFGEALKDGAVDRKPGGKIRYAKVRGALTHPGVYRVPFAPDKQNTSSAAIKLPGEIGTIMPFRYVEVEQCPYSVTKETIRQIAVTYPFNNEAANFVSSDPRLDEVYNFCKYSIRATSFAGVYVDGDRERIPYEADAYINQLCHYSLDRDFTMARYTHEYLMKHPTWPTEWKQHSIMMAWNDWMYTGNKESLERCYDDLKDKKLLLFLAPGTNDFIVTQGPFKAMKDGSRDIVDWPYCERDGFVFTRTNIVINAFHLLNLRQMAEIAEALGKTEDAERFRAREEVLRGKFHETFYNPRRGCYRDGVGTDHSSLHANMFPMAFGLVPEEERGRVASFIHWRGMSCSVYGAQYLLEALYEAGLEKDALDLMVSDDLRSWRNMMNVGSTITMEAWDKMLKPNLDWNHAWGAAPANIIPRYVLGIRPMEPGFGVVMIRPRVANLTAVEGFVPTIRGKISVGVRQEPQKNYTLHFTIPYNTQAHVAIPFWKGTTVFLDGAEVSPRAWRDSLILDGVESGTHTVTMTAEPISFKEEWSRRVKDGIDWVKFW